MDDKTYIEKFEHLARLVREHLETAPGCHDFEHVMRVFHNARLILETESGAEARVVELATLLHDIARPEEMAANGSICHAEHGAKLAIPFLEKCGFRDSGMMEKISFCILRHRYRGQNKPETLNEKIVYDADKLDSIGAVGIGRAFHFAGRTGAKLHNTEEEALASTAYSSGDTAYREYLVKLRNVPERMLTPTGRSLAVIRADFMDDFFKTLNTEVSGPM